MVLLSERRVKFLEILSLESPEREHELSEFAGKLIDAFDFFESSSIQRLSNLKALYKAAVDFTTLQEPSGVLTRLINLVVEELGVGRCSIFVVDSSHRKVVLKYHVGFEIPENVSPSVDFGEGIVGKVVQSGKSLRIEDIEKNSELESHPDRYYNNSFICVPIFTRDSVVGVINVTDKYDGTVFFPKQMKNF